MIKMPNVMPAPAACLVVAAGLLAATQVHAVTRAARFETGNEGWLVANITDLPGAGTAATWDSANQRITATDIYTWTTFSAPADLLGNRVAFYGGTLSFDLQDTLKDDNADSIATFGIAAGATAMFWFGGSPSTTTLTTFTATLDENDSRWRIGGSPLDIGTGTAPTAAQFQAVLGSLTMLRINADWRTAGVDVSTLDNVVLQSAVPEPAPAVLLAAGIAALAWRQQQRQRQRRRSA